MSYLVRIRENATGEVRECQQGGLDWDEHSDYWWTEGNMSCDCNRGLYFQRAAGENPDVMAAECSDGKYRCIEAVLPDGTVILLEGE